MKKNALLVAIFILIPILGAVIVKEQYTRKKTTWYQYQVYQQPISEIPIVETDKIRELASVNASAYIVTDVDSGVVLAEKNADMLFFPASTVKMMTALVAKEKYPLNMLVTVPSSSIGLGEKPLFFSNAIFTVSDLLKAALIQSNNSAALSLAAADPEGTGHFVEEMNKKAVELSLTHTRFDNPVGFDGEYIQSTARDLSILAKELIEDEELKNIVNTKETKITDVITQRQFSLYNTNALLGFNNQVFGIKTGTTDQAGQVLVSLIRKDDHDVIVVVLESKNRYEDTKTLLQWINTAVQWYTKDELILTEAR